MGETYDIAVVGAGPAGIVVGLAAKKYGLRAVLLDKGTICNTIYHFPERMRFFSTADLLEFSGIPLVASADKPMRHEVLMYFTRIALDAKLEIATFEHVARITRNSSGFAVKTNRRTIAARSVVLAIGTYDQPNLLNVPGEDLPKVSHYYGSPHPYIGKKVLIVGGKNSAVEAALDLHRHAATVSMVHRHQWLRGASIKYWLLPDLLNRLREGSISRYWNSTVKQIEPERVLLTTHDGDLWIENDFILALTGYHPDYSFLEAAGVIMEGEMRAPKHNPETLETNVPGLFVAGVVTAGSDPGKVFIENSRNHGEMIVAALRKRWTL